MRPRPSARLLAALAALGASALPACGSPDAPAGAAATLVRVDPEPAGEVCPDGGAAIRTGQDDDGDGYLDDTEVDSTQRVCNGPPVVQCAGGNVLTGTVTITRDADWAQLAGVDCVDGDVLATGTTGELPALPDLGIITGDLVLVANPGVTTLAGLDHLRWVGGTYLIQGNDALLDVRGLGALQRVINLTLVGNNALPHLDGMEAFTDLHANLTIANNVSLVDLAGLDGLVTASGNLIIRSNPQLASLAALGRLRSAKSLELSGNLALARVDLPALANVDFRTQILTSPALTAISLPALTTTGDLIRIDGNGGLTQVSAPVLQTCGGLQVTNDNALAQLDAPALLFATGAVALTTLPQLRQLDLGRLRSIGGELALRATPALPDLRGLGALQAIGGPFTVNGAAALTSFAGLGALELVSGSMTVTTNAQLTSFAGLEAFGVVGQDLTITGNAALPKATATAFAASITVHGTTTIN